MQNETELVTPLEAALMLRLKECTIRKWMWERKLGRVKLGRRVFLRRSELTTMITSCFIPPSFEAHNPPRLGSPIGC